MADTSTHSLETGVSWMRAAGESTRLRLLALLYKSDLTVTDLVSILDQSQPRVSRHLRLLVEAGLAERFQEGAWAYFRAVDRGAVKVFLDTMVGPLADDDLVLAKDFQRLEVIRNKRAERAAAYFSKNAERWNKMRALHISEAAVEAAVLEMGQRHGPKSVLDLGSGTGRILQLFAPHIERGVGIDSSADMLSLARTAIAAPEFSHLQVRQGDAYALDSDSKYDLIVLHLVLHFLEEPVRALEQASQCLAENGRILIVDFAPHELEFLRDEHAHRRLGMSTKQVSRWLGEAGLAMEDVRSLEPDQGEAEPLNVMLWLAER